MAQEKPQLKFESNPCNNFRDNRCRSRTDGRTGQRTVPCGTLLYGTIDRALWNYDIVYVRTVPYGTESFHGLWNQEAILYGTIRLSTGL